MKRTQRKWRVIKDGKNAIYVVDGHRDNLVCAVLGSDAETNAKLIEAAPEMLETLQDIKRMMESDMTIQIKKINSILACEHAIKNAS